jgi:hypothetical protein
MLRSGDLASLRRYSNTLRRDDLASLHRYSNMFSLTIFVGLPKHVALLGPVSYQT